MKYFIMFAVWFMFGWVFAVEYAEAKGGVGISLGTDYTELKLMSVKKSGYINFGLFELTDGEYGMYGVTMGATPQFRFDEDYSRIQWVVPVFIGVGNADVDLTNRIVKRAGMFYGVGTGFRIRLIGRTKLEVGMRRQWSHKTNTFDLNEVETQRSLGLMSLTYSP